MTYDLILADLKGQYGEQAVLTPRDVAAQLGRTPQAVANLKHRGTLPFPTVEVGDRYGVSIYDFADWLASGSKPKGAKAKASAPPPVPPPANRRKNLAAMLLAFQQQRDFLADLCRELECLVLEAEAEDAAGSDANNGQEKSRHDGRL
jgi:hypothetical protein